MSDSSSLSPHAASTTVALLFQTSTLSPGLFGSYALVPRGYIATSWSSVLKNQKPKNAGIFFFFLDLLLRISSACRWGLGPQVIIFILIVFFREWLFSLRVWTNVFPNELTRVLSCESIVWNVRAVTAVFFFLGVGGGGGSTFPRISWLCFVKLLDGSLGEFISSRLLEWWRGFWDTLWNSNNIITTKRRFGFFCFLFFCNAMRQQIFVSLASGSVKDLFFPHFHAPYKSLLGIKTKQNKTRQTRQNWALSSCCYLSSVNGAIPWVGLLPSAGVKEDYKPHAPSDTAGLPIKSSWTSCYVKTAALPYVSLQAIYSKKTNKWARPQRF